MKPNIMLLSLLSAGLILSSCSDERESIDSNNKVKKVVASLNDYEEEAENTATRMHYSFGANGYNTAWSMGDTLGIYPLGGDQVSFPISEGAGTKNAVFDGGTWALRADCWYAAYYPFRVDNCFFPETAIPVSYIGQLQNGNNTTNHLAKFDYMAAPSVKPSSNGSVMFQFQHLGTILQIHLSLPKAGTYNRLTLYSNKGQFISKGVVDLSSKEPVIKGVRMSNAVSIDLRDITISSEDLHITVNMMIAPVDLSGSTIEINVTDVKGNNYSNAGDIWTRTSAFKPNTVCIVSSTLIECSKPQVGDGFADENFGIE